MFTLWLIVLVVYGIAAGFEHIPLLFWLLLLPFQVQDWYDKKHK